MGVGGNQEMIEEEVGQRILTALKKVSPPTCCVRSLGSMGVSARGWGRGGDNQEMTEEEVGQRILTALKKVSPPTGFVRSLSFNFKGNGKYGPFVAYGLIRQNLCGTGTRTDTMYKYRSHLSSHISCSVEAKHKIVQPIFSQVPVPFKLCLNEPSLRQSQGLCNDKV